jgi:hypothetical protein
MLHLQAYLRQCDGAREDFSSFLPAYGLSVKGNGGLQSYITSSSLRMGAQDFTYSYIACLEKA